MQQTLFKSFTTQFRRYTVSIPRNALTKESRKELFGSVAGGAGSMKPEEFQRSKIEELTQLPVSRTNMRLHYAKKSLVECSRPLLEPDGFEYSENFDGVQCTGTKWIYINLKCIVGQGGHQTRSLREVYWFIKGQIDYINMVPDSEVYFSNILDGDTVVSHFPKFESLLENSPGIVQRKIYIGDISGYPDWFSKIK